MNEDLYFIRRQGTNEFAMGTGMYAVPKLYRLGHARAFVTRAWRRTQTVWEIIPVNITLGTPV